MSAMTQLTKLATAVCVVITVAVIALKLIKFGWGATQLGRATGVL